MMRTHLAGLVAVLGAAGAWPLSPVFAGSATAQSGRATVDTRLPQANTLVVTVLDGASGSAVPGAAVTAGATVRTTDSAGRAAFATVADGAGLAIVKAGYQSLAAVCRVPGAGTYRQTERLQAALSNRVPVIRKVSVLPSDVALQAPGLNIPLTFEVTADWKQSSGGSVLHDTGRRTGARNRSEPAVQVILNPTLDLPYDAAPIPRLRAVTFRAQNGAGLSAPVTRNVWAMALPPWLDPADTYYRGSGAVRQPTARWVPLGFRHEFLPASARSINLELFTVESSIATEAAGHLKFQTAPTFGGWGNFEGELAGGVTIRGNNALPGGPPSREGVSVSGRFSLDGPWYPALALADKSALEARIRGTANVTVPLRGILGLDPGGTAFGFREWADSLGPGVRSRLENFAGVEGCIRPDAAIHLPVSAGPEGLYMVSPAPLPLGGALDFRARVGVPPLHVEVLLAGAYALWLSAMPEGVSFDHAEAVACGSVTAGLGLWEWRTPVMWTRRVPEFRNPETPVTTPLGAVPVAAEVSLVSRDYAGPGYARFMPPLRAAAAGSLPPGPLGAVHADVFMENVFPNITASLCGAGTDDVWVVFSHDNTNRVQVQALDIQFTHYDGSRWSEPAPVATNSQSELFPVVALDSVGRPVAAWSRVRDVDYTATNDPVGFLSQLDVVAASYDRERERWTEAAVISVTPCLNVGQTLARAPGGELALWWESNAANRFAGGGIGPGAAPSAWWWSRWEAGAAQFGPAEAIATNVVGASSPAFVHGGSQAWLFWAQDLDGDAVTTNDTALQYRAWDGSAWSPVGTLSPSGAVVTAVQAVLLTNGVPLVVWWQNGDLVQARGPAFVAPTVARANSGGLCLQEFRLVAGPANGSAVLVFPSSRSNAVSLTYRVYDAAADAWGGDFVFEGSDSLDFNLAPAFVGPQLQAAYARGQLAHSNVTVAANGSNMVVRVPYRAQTDLMVSRFEFDADLAVTALDVPAGYPPVVRVTVANTGGLPVSNTVIDIRRDSVTGPLAMTLTNATVMLPHTRHELVAPWPVSAETAGCVLAAVIDPAGRVAECLESNNAITNRVLRSALALDGVRLEARTGANVTGYVQLRNPLARALRDVAVSLRRDATNGVLLSLVTVTNLAACSTVEVELPFGGADLTETDGVVAVAEAALADGDDAPARAVLAITGGTGDGMPAAARELRFLRPGVSNAQVVAWAGPTNAYDGVYVLRRLGTNAEEVAGFAVNPEAVFGDPGAASATQVTYRVRAYNASGVGPASPSIVTNAADGNGDGLPDAWQVTFFGSVTWGEAGLDADPDHDGIPNGREYVFGTSPTDATDLPRIGIAADAQHRAVLGWHGAALQAYGVESSTDLATWSAAGPRVVGVEGSNVWVDTAGGATSRFYRVVAP